MTFYIPSKFEEAINRYWLGDKKACAKDCGMSRTTIYNLLKGKVDKTTVLETIWIEINKKRRAWGDPPLSRKGFINGTD